MNLSFDQRINPAFPGGREVKGLQALKLLCAFFVVVIHVAPLQESTLRWIASVAVPVFFMITGFFMVGSDGTLSAQRVLRMLRKLVALVVITQLLYVAHYTLMSLFVWNVVPDALCNPRALLTTIFVGDKFGGHLWYLNSAVESVAVIWLFTRFKAERLLYLVIPVGLLLNLSLGAYAGFAGVEGVERFVHRNFITVGLPCIMIGVAMRRNPFPLRQSALWIATAVCIALLVVEYRCLSHSRGDVLLMTVPAAIAAFMAFAGCSAPTWLAAMGARFATGIYIFHKIVLDHVVAVDSLTDGYGILLITLVLTLAVVASFCYLVANLRINGVARQSPERRVP